jgi:hypothetical protein
MGDRANVKYIEDDKNVIHFYTHWSGTELPETLRVALERGKERWDDSQYLARIIFCEMVRGAERALNGFGISTRVGDGEDRVVTVDVVNQTVTLSGKTLSFQEYVDQAEPCWAKSEVD